MVTIARLRLKNWKCYKGESTLDLSHQVYAVVAREKDNAERSNFLGKSSLCEAVEFALYGRLPPDARRKQDWISKGERSGEVDLTLSDGSRIVRTQTLTGSEKLLYFPPNDPTRGAAQGEAQKQIETLVGLSREDFGATRFFRQGEMARLINMDPGPRLDLVAGWLKLGPVQECEDAAVATLRELVRQRDAAIGQVRVYQEQAALADQEAAALEELTDQCEEKSAELRGMVEEEKRAAALAELAAAAAAYDRTVEEGKRQAKALAEAGNRQTLAARASEAQEKLKEAAGRVNEAEQKATSLRRLAVGDFDGRCPLVGQACPSAAFVVQLGKANRSEREEAERQASYSGEVYAAASQAASDAIGKSKALDFQVASLENLRAEARRLKPSKDRFESLKLEAELTPAQSSEPFRAELAALTRKLAAAEAAQARAEAAKKKLEECQGQADALDKAIRTASMAAQIFGKNGAQRRLAESALGEIEGLACEMLSRAGIPLAVRVVWAREGSGLASTCGACGEPFPRSEKVKACTRCGGERGPNLVSKLEIEPSAQSGGARDLVGIFVQMAAAAWLAEDRGSRWATALLDEPVGALDAHNRRAFSSHLPELLRMAGVRQAFVVAHHASVLDALPARIQITSEGGWSRLEVIG